MWIGGEIVIIHAKFWSFASYTLRLMTWNVKNGSLVPHLPYGQGEQKSWIQGTIALKPSGSFATLYSLEKDDLFSHS